jgi:hypothetical protein
MRTEAVDDSRIGARAFKAGFALNDYKAVKRAGRYGRYAVIR